MAWVFVSEKKCMHNFCLLTVTFFYLVRISTTRFIIVYKSVCLAVFVAVCVSV